MGSLRQSPPPSRRHPRSSPHRNPSRLPRSTLDGKTYKMGVGMRVAEGRTMGYGQRCSSGRSGCRVCTD
uniref:Uncharacterized protein n=1 Tax=Triticum urartu TaxID=4572 RepID=A0A8R7UNM0_TRIUA